MITLSTGLRAGILNQYGVARYMNHGVIDVYSGTPPISADAAATGIRLGRVTKYGGEFVDDDYTNGCVLAQTVGGALIDDGTWVLTVTATGQIGWWRWRWYLSDPNTSDPYYPRVDGAYGEGLVLASPFVTAGYSINVQFYLNIIGGGQ